MGAKRRKGEPRAGRKKPRSRRGCKGASWSLSREEQHFIFTRIAEARILGERVRPYVVAAFQDRYGRELVPGTLQYYLYDPRTQERRERHVRDLMFETDPAKTPTLSLQYVNSKLDQCINESLQERLLDRKVDRVQEDGEWRDVHVDVMGNKPETAVKALEVKLKLLRERELYLSGELPDATRPSAPYKGPGRGKSSGAGQEGMDAASDAANAEFGKMQPIRGSGGGAEKDLEDYRTDPETAQELIAQEHTPFGAPEDDESFCPAERHGVMSAKAHAEMLRRWEEEGIPPDGFPSKPTRIVKKDGTVVILKDDENAPKSYSGDEDEDEAVTPPGEEEIDLGEALLAPEAEEQT